MTNQRNALRDKEIFDYCQEFSRKEASIKFNLNKSNIARSIRRHLKRIGMEVPPGKRVFDREITNKPIEESVTNFEQKDDSASVSGQARTIDELLEKAKIDTRIWEVDSVEIKDNSWDVTMKNIDRDTEYKDGKKSGHDIQTPGGDTKTNRQFYIKVRLKKRKDYLQVILPDLLKDISKYSFTHFTPKHNTGSGIALEAALLDAHFGKLAWLGETGYRNYDTDISMEDYQYAIEKSLNWSSHEKIEKIFYIVGQDLFHVDNLQGNTTSGDHAMDVDGRLPKIIRKAQHVLFNSIHKCREVAPVEVIWSPGNHDNLQSLNFCMMIEQHFLSDKFVTVDIDQSPGPITRKARLWGNLLVGWTHRIVGKENTWGNELAQAFPKMWGESKLREWHCGDQHKHRTLKTMPEFTSGGVLIRQLTALSPVDRWHFENTFTDAVPGGESFLWSKDCGVYANYMAWTSQYDEYRNKLVNSIK